MRIMFLLLVPQVLGKTYLCRCIHKPVASKKKSEPWADNKCHDCAATFKPKARALAEASLDDDSEGNCPKGQFKVGWFCLLCPPGRHCPRDNQNWEFTPGFYAPGGAAWCSRSPVGTISNMYGWFDCRNCNHDQKCLAPPFTKLPSELVKIVESGGKWEGEIYSGEEPLFRFGR